MRNSVLELANKVSERFPATEENVGLYRGMSVVWALGAAAMTEATLKYAEQGHPITDPQTALSTALSVGAVGVSILLNDRANMSRSEQ